MNQRYNIGPLSTRIFEQISWHQRNQYEKNWEKSTKRTEKPLSFPFNCATDKLHYLLKLYLASKKHSHCYPYLRPKSHLSLTTTAVNTERAGWSASLFTLGWKPKQGWLMYLQCKTKQTLYSLPCAMLLASKLISPREYPHNLNIWTQT